MAVRVNGVVCCVEPTVSCRPEGDDWKVTATVCGSILRTAVVLAPPESVAVSRSSRYDGYSWSGAANEPLRTPVKVCSGWSWQVDGQCSRTTDHDRADAGSVPSSVSVAAPEKLIVSPTFQVVPALGASIVGV